MARPQGYWRTFPVDNDWLAERQNDLTSEKLNELVKLRGFPSADKLLGATTHVGYLPELRRWTLGAYAWDGMCYAVRAYNPAAEVKFHWIGWARINQYERAGRAVGRIFDLCWVTDHIQNAMASNKGGGWLWVTAGEWDCLMLRCFGWMATTSTFGEGSKPQPDMLLREFGGKEAATALLSLVRGIVVVFDVDDAGRRGTVQFVDAFERMLREYDIQLANWHGVRAVDLRQLPGWDGDEDSGWDVSNLVQWAGRNGGMPIAGQALRAAADDAVAGADLVREMLGIPEDEDISSKPNLNDALVANKLKTIEWPSLLEALLWGLSRYGSRAQACWHMAHVASHNGWLHSELATDEHIAEIQAIIEKHSPKKDHPFPLSQLQYEIKRPFLDLQNQDNLCTDRANAQRVKHYFPFFRSHPARGILHWDNIKWQPGDQLLADHIQRLPDYIEEEANAQYQAGNNATGASLKSWAKKSQQFGRMGATLSWVKKTTALELSADLGEQWDRNGLVIAGPLGVVDLVSGDLLRGRAARDMYCSMSSRGTIMLDGLGERTWGADNWTRCNKFWRGLLEQWQQGEHAVTIIEMLQNLAGMSLRGQLDEMLIVLQGSGRSGKSAFLQGLAYALGDYAMELPGAVILRGSQATSSNFRVSSLAQMDHKRMIRISEVGGKTLDVDMIKQITGENTVTGKLLFKNPAESVMNHTAFLMTNRELDLRGELSEAVRGRLWIIPFDTTFVTSARIGDDEYRSGVSEGTVLEARDDIKTKLMGQVGGFEPMPDIILTWAWHGLKRVISRGGLDIPDTVRQKTNAMWATSDVFGEYWQESGIWLAGGKTMIATDWLYNNVKSWAEQWDTDLKERIGSKQQFSELLKTQASRGFVSGRSMKAMFARPGRQDNCWTVPYTYNGPKEGKVN